jgi:signal transduction histidine kinase
LVEDSEPDGLLLARALQRGGFDCQLLRIQRRAEMEEALKTKEWDLILADHAMPQFSAPEALEMLKDSGLDIPFIIVSGHIEEETAVEAMRAGAHDYIMKDRLARLVPAVERELREAQVRHEQRQYQDELRRAREELETRVERRTADLKGANQRLQELLEERKRLENELLEIAENERRRIGFDLHDDLGQKLTGASLMVRGLQQKLSHLGHPCAEDATRIQSLMEEIAHHTHDLARQFSSMSMRGADLCSALQSLADNVKRMFDIPCAFSAKGVMPGMPENTLLQLQKITQEAVSNAIKHGKATQVAISVVTSADGLLLTIKNDGLPFSVPETARNRMGLRIMKYRANTIGAKLEIKAKGKNGTTVTCSLPATNGAGLGQALASSRDKALEPQAPAAKGI